MAHMILDAVAAETFHFFLIHAVWTIPVVVGLVLAFVPGAPAAMLSFVRSSVGRIVIALVVASVTGWEVRGAIDASWDRSARFRSDLDAANARATIEAARAAENARLAMAQHDIADAAAERERAATEAVDSLQEQVDSYASELSRSPAPAGCRLTDGDARRLRAIALPAARR